MATRRRKKISNAWALKHIEQALVQLRSSDAAVQRALALIEEQQRQIAKLQAEVERLQKADAHLEALRQLRAEEFFHA